MEHAILALSFATCIASFTVACLVFKALGFTTLPQPWAGMVLASLWLTLWVPLLLGAIVMIIKLDYTTSDRASS